MTNLGNQVSATCASKRRRSADAQSLSFLTWTGTTPRVDERRRATPRGDLSSFDGSTDARSSADRAPLRHSPVATPGNPAHFHPGDIGRRRQRARLRVGARRRLGVSKGSDASVQKFLQSLWRLEACLRAGILKKVETARRATRPTSASSSARGGAAG